MTEAMRTSYSALNLHRKCPQAWFYARVERLGKAEDAVARDAGTWWQAVRVAESLERGREHSSLHSVPRKIKTTDHGPVFRGESMTVSEVCEAMDAWYAQQPESYQDECEKYLGWPLPHRIKHALARWLERWEEDLAYEHPLGLEVWWSRDLPQPEDAHPDSKPVTIGGFLDEVLLDTRRDLVIIRDNKFTKNIDKSTLEDMMDSQLQLYPWGAQRLIRSWGAGRLGAVSFDRARSTMAVPQLTRSGALSKQVTAFDAETYRQWAQGPDGEGIPYPGIRKDGSGAGIYTLEDAVLEKLSQPEEQDRWFQRTLTPINRNLVATHLRSAVDSAEDIQRSKRRIEKYGEAQRNLTNMCGWCEFAKLCRAQMVGGPEGEYEPEDYGLVRRPR